MQWRKCSSSATRSAKGSSLGVGGSTSARSATAATAKLNLSGQRVQPFWIENEARAIDGTTFVVGLMFAPHVVRDGNLITGQQQNSGVAAARVVIEALEA